jgi:hypothetical protein
MRVQLGRLRWLRRPSIDRHRSHSRLRKRFGDRGQEIRGHRRDGYFTEMKSRTWLFCLIFAFVPFNEDEVEIRSIHYQPLFSQSTSPV